MMMRRAMMTRRCCFLLMLGIAGLAPAGGGTVTLDVPASVDVWHYFNAINPAGRQLAPSFLLPPTFPGGDRRDAVVAVIFRPQLPPGFSPAFRVTEASITYYDIKESAWVSGGLNAYGGTSEIELFAAGFGPTYAEGTWNGTQPFIGGNNDTTLPRDPFPRDLSTDANVQNTVIGQTPWAIGIPIGYTPGAMTAPFPVRFVLDVSHPAIQAELVEDLQRGSSSWIVSSTFDADFMGEPGTIPSFITLEGVPAHPGSQAPTIHLVVEELAISSAPGWSLYE